jgi:tRNA/tmRNA/rRNA uracil-C5-methylase (TrmA/RlmC/RlmD family)
MRPRTSHEVEATLSAEGRVHLRLVDARRGHSPSKEHPVHEGHSAGGAGASSEAARFVSIPHPRLSPFLVHEESFVQPHAEALFLYSRVLEEALGDFLALAGDALPSPLRYWDLYCGSGAFSFTPFFQDGPARGGRPAVVSAVEGVSRAVESCRGNFARNAKHFPTGTVADLQAHFQAHLSDVRVFVEEASTGLHPVPHVVVADPPRDGMGAETTAALARLMARGAATEGRAATECAPGMIIYIACDSASLARDLGPLVSSGFTLRALHLFDTFAQSAHFEAAAILHRGIP